MAVKKVQRSTRAPSHKFARQIVKNKEPKKQITSVDVKNKKTVIIAQEIKFARLLSSNDKKVRDKVLKNLRKWLTVRSNSSFAFTEADFMRLWKGLYYCMWMSDKPLIQEELAESLSKIVHCFNNKDAVLLYTACVLKTLGTEWYGIDQYRLDKFCMLTRRIIRQTFQKCKEMSWDLEWVKGISEILEKILVDKKMCPGFSMHLTEVFFEELSKISGGDISEEAITVFIKPFISYFITMDDEIQIKHVMKHIFEYLIYQSDVGLDYMEKFRAWRDAGFPAGSIDAMEKIEMSDEDIEDNDIREEDNFLQEKMKTNTEKPLDPRAGRVDVELPQIPFNAEAIATLLTQYKFHSSSTTQSRRQLRCLIKDFTELSRGEMPLGVKEIRAPKTQKKDTNTKTAAVRLLKLEEDLHSDNVKKKRKRKLNDRLIEDESSEFSEEEDFEDVNDKDSIKIDDIKPTRKKKKVDDKIDTKDNLTQKNSQILDTNIPDSKKKKQKAKEKDHNTLKVDVQNGDCTLNKNSSIKTGTDTKKIKLKGKKSTTANMLNVVTPVKRKKKTKLKVCGKWDVSDNAVLSTPMSLNDVRKDPQKPITNDTVKKNDTYNKQPTWLQSVLRKLENEKSKTSISLKEQYKNNNDLNSKKRVKIALQRNTAQHTSEYILQVRKSPSIPFDANKKPLAGVLKASPIPSPINPFYRKI
ncbi:ribosomal RNA processing protein 1 homolog Nnp-1 [Calliopsis andreniformis]|uniref:ribosomal RNA processing protein 1 homolog Nnp-1 n=1 Tax=Calliopsis andreniformis TaxID=337506 RepID=UPI003FCD9DCB